MLGEEAHDFRFFDDDPGTTGTTFPLFEAIVENRNQLVSAPPAVLLIMSRPFGEKIREELKPLLPESVEIHTWRSIYEQ